MIRNTDQLLVIIMWGMRCAAGRLAAFRDRADPKVGDWGSASASQRVTAFSSATMIVVASSVVDVALQAVAGRQWLRERALGRHNLDGDELVEHPGFMEKVRPSEKRKNNNGMLYRGVASVSLWVRS